MQTALFFVLVVMGLSMLLTGVSHFSVARVSRQRFPTPQRLPGVSVLKPLKGVDDDLYENLLSLARQDYPEFELIFGCEDPRDPALEVVARLLREHPGLPARVVCGGVTSASAASGNSSACRPEAGPAGLNPKVRNLQRLSASARHDWILISDANVRARPDYLQAMVAEVQDPAVGLVSSLLAGTGERTFGARLDNLQLNSFVARGVCTAKVWASHACVVGKSMLLRQTQLRRVGGWDCVADVLSEDYELGRRFQRAGLKVALSPHVLLAHCAERSVPEFCARHVRWSQMRRHINPWVYGLELLHSPLPWAMAAVPLLVLGGGGQRVCLLAAGVGTCVILRLLSDAALQRRLRGTTLELYDYLAIPIKDLLSIGIWFWAGVRRTVRWRGHRMRIVAGARLVPARSTSHRVTLRIAQGLLALCSHLKARLKLLVEVGAPGADGEQVTGRPS